jgi:hypothetical protein
MKHGDKMNKYEDDIQHIFAILKQLVNKPNRPRQRIGFRRSNEET